MEESSNDTTDLNRSRWSPLQGYKKNELARRYAIFYTGASISGALGGILAGAITGNLDGAGGLEGWRYLFLVRRIFACWYELFTHLVTCFIVIFSSSDRGGGDSPYRHCISLRPAGFPKQHVVDQRG